jgi:hypothetical protein
MLGIVERFLAERPDHSCASSCGRSAKGCVDIGCPADLRPAPVMHQAAVLVGHPATGFSSAFKAPEVALRELGRLLTAPVAPTVRLILPADAPPLRQKQEQRGRSSRC